MSKSALIVSQLKDKGEISLYGVIGKYEDITAAIFDKELTALEKMYDNIDMRVNCVGGGVYDGIAIRNRVKRSKITDIYVDGIAASIAAAIFMSGKRRHMSKYARVMTHRCSGIAEGNGDDMRANADEMDAIDNDMSAMIAEAAGITVEEAKTLYINSTDRYLTAEQAEKAGLIHSIYDADPVEIPAIANTGRKMYELYQAAITAKLSTNEKSIIILL